MLSPWFFFCAAFLLLWLKCTHDGLEPPVEFNRSLFRRRDLPRVEQFIYLTLSEDLWDKETNYSETGFPTLLTTCNYVRTIWIWIYMDLYGVIGTNKGVQDNHCWIIELWNVVDCEFWTQQLLNDPGAWGVLKELVQHVQQHRAKIWRKNPPNCSDGGGSSKQFGFDCGLWKCVACSSGILCHASPTSCQQPALSQGSSCCSRFCHQLAWKQTVTAQGSK